MFADRVRVETYAASLSVEFMLDHGVPRPSAINCLVTAVVNAHPSEAIISLFGRDKLDAFISLIGSFCCARHPTNRTVIRDHQKHPVDLPNSFKRAKSPFRRLRCLWHSFFPSFAM